MIKSYKENLVIFSAESFTPDCWYLSDLTLETIPPLFNQVNTPCSCRMFRYAIGQFSDHRATIVYFLSLCKVEKEWSRCSFSTVSIPLSCLEQKSHQLPLQCMIFQNLTEGKNKYFVSVIMSVLPHCWRSHHWLFSLDLKTSQDMGMESCGNVGGYRMGSGEQREWGDF